MAGVVRHTAGQRDVSVRLIALGSVALALGVLVYLTDRDPSRAPLVPAVSVLAGMALFGAAAAWLPSLVHPFAFSLLTAAVQPPQRPPAYWVCALWWGIDTGFELLQVAPVADACSAVLGALPANPVTGAISNYARHGTFDPADLAAIAGGALAAALVLHIFQRPETNDGA